MPPELEHRETAVPLHKILVPVDGTPHSESILPYVEKLARVHRAKIELLRVIDPLAFTGEVPGADLSGKERERVNQVRKYLFDLKSKFEEGAVESICALGPVEEVIQDRARTKQCDLIAFAPRGHSGLKRWLYGSVAEAVIRHSPCPVLLVRGETNVHFHHLLLPLDGLDHLEPLLRGIQPFLTATTRLTLLHCCAKGVVESGLRSQAQELVKQRPNTNFVACDSKAPQGILDWAADSDCDLIAMSTHGLGGIHHLWKGSVTEQVARQAPCPTLVFPPEWTAPAI